MKTTILALLTLIFVSGCKKEPYEKKVRKVEISFSDQASIKFDGYNWSNNCSTNSVVVYKKVGENISFEVSVCNTQFVSVKVTSGGKVIYDKNAKIHDVSLAID